MPKVSARRPFFKNAGHSVRQPFFFLNTHFFCATNNFFALDIAKHDSTPDSKHLRSDRQHAFRLKLITVINDWAKILDIGGQVDTFILDFEKAIHPRMNYLNASCMGMVLVERL